MKSKIYYLAHPVGAPDTAGIQANLADTRAWLRKLFELYPKLTFIAPWMAEVEAFLEVGKAVEAETVQKALDDDIAVVCRCDGIILTGAKISPGMAIERSAALATDKVVVDVTGYDADDFNDPIDIWDLWEATK